MNALIFWCFIFITYIVGVSGIVKFTFKALLNFLENKLHFNVAMSTTANYLSYQRIEKAATNLSYFFKNRFYMLLMKLLLQKLQLLQ
jgi:hypothetical protein